MEVTIEEFERRLAMELGNRDMIIVKQSMEIEGLKAKIQLLDQQKEDK